MPDTDSPHSPDGTDSPDSTDGAARTGAEPPTPADEEPTRPADDPPGDRLRGWLAALVLGIIGGIVRFQDLGFPTDKGTPVFDEKHYTPQAWQMLRNGGFEDNPGYMLTVHPPLGKSLIALGEQLFGYDGWGWRFTAALCGTLMVVLAVRIGRRLTRSTWFGALAGLLVIADGVSHLQSRMGMLDIFLAFFVLAAFACVLVDRDQVRARLAVAAAEGWVGADALGPRLGVRWWRLGAGVLLGLACGVKWSGLYYIAAFGLLTVLFDLSARRAAGVRKPLLSTLARDVLPGLWAFVVVGLVAYLATYWGWFASETGYARNLVETTGSDPVSVARGALGSLFENSVKILDFHESLVTPEKPHPWESKPWTWPMGLRPMLYYYDGSLTGCGAASCVSATMLVGTPAMWWLAFPVLAWSLWRVLGRRDWRYAAVLVGYLAGLLPWFLNVDRQMYFFYATPMAAFLVLGIVLVLQQLSRVPGGRWVVGVYAVLVVANFAWLWPILNGDPITPGHWQAELWLPSWR
ncbi:dolichyl-phosphate-mannose--protein mannosyltransferase [Actinokineospora bangkokensis]|uniref:Polyprenol-phosphate-mannose--protein mannosyltransferase n=1 Tax=Actinokineospora bangkokensis TaxID=1193682 RepID=A0A1Q9LJS2_9PSEU|nr:dolichyl-phosphate-mannose--protein mannosyltransferase [Actinokineospora bangkokensis]